ncbi:DNA internalization-related competence protein ComEC/Rec2 [Parendozoicomonas sp. Alg238-R29]|uniref:DNA internalization-related competence protein ComEC/Rec2 n=1 Tax=Parendozoicomonas sp. Alg238-R29 TaxID=2993446 RepID=UPI00248D8387|nr:DNA internalization-related competence protein ComEC/Rec2 [Parendozoicomonas sp. Alg238-R29]
MSIYLRADAYPVVLIISAASLLILTAVLRKTFPYLLFIALLGGFVYGGWNQIQRVNNWLPDEFAGRDLKMYGKIANLPDIKGERTRFIFSGEIIPPAGLPIIDNKVSLSWFDAPQLLPGEIRQLCVRLKQPHGFASEGAGDYQTVLLRQGITATGYVRACDEIENLLLEGVPATGVLVWRNQLSQWLENHLPETGGGIVRALLLGDTRGVSQESWQIFRKTGTVHLLVISGLHVSLMALFGWGLIRCMALLGVLPLHSWPVPVLGRVAGLGMALLYSLMAGFGLPVQRALIMLGVGSAVLSLGFRLPRLTIYLFALCSVLIIEPLGVTANGFWLSFLAVAALLYAFSYRRSESRFGSIFWSQLVVALALTPVLASMHQPVNFFSPFVNLVSIPLVGLILIPLIFIGIILSAFWQTVGLTILQWVSRVLEIWQSSLGWVVQLTPEGLLVPVPALPVMLMAAVGVAIVLTPAALGWRWLGLFCFIPWLWPVVKKPDERTVEISVLDVGQGLAVAVRTRNHSLVYDTGDRFSPHFSAAEAVILPYLQQGGHLYPDKIIISHSDRDHIGGLDVLRSHFPEAEFFVPEDNLGNYCMAGTGWEWDAVKFEYLGAGNGLDHLPVNDRSCVIKVCAGSDCALLTGDITKRRERLLIEQYGETLQSQLLLAPHHGSDSSSTAAFLNTVKPAYASVSAGYKNKFHHPAIAVIRRYHDRQITVLNTAETGTQTYVLGKQGGLKLSCYRERAGYWWSRFLHDGRQLENCEPVRSMAGRLAQGLW